MTWGIEIKLPKINTHFAQNIPSRSKDWTQNQHKLKVNSMSIDQSFLVLDIVTINPSNFMWSTSLKNQNLCTRKEIPKFLIFISSKLQTKKMLLSRRINKFWIPNQALNMNKTLIKSWFHTKPFTLVKNRRKLL